MIVHKNIIKFLFAILIGSLLFGLYTATDRVIQDRDDRISLLSDKDFVNCKTNARKRNHEGRSGYHTMSCVFEDAPNKELFCITGFQSTSCNWEKYNE